MSDIKLPVSNKQADHKSKVDIKKICQKFENLSNTTENNTNFAETPVPPVRRKRISHHDNNIKSSAHKPADLKCFPDLGTNLSINKSHNAMPQSVKERTKLFESPSSIEEPAVNSAVSKFKRDSRRMSQTGASPNLPDVCKKFESPVELSANIAPAKPPRSFTHSDSNVDSAPRRKLDTSVRKFVLNHNERRNSESEIKRTSSVDSSESSEGILPNNTRLRSASEIIEKSLSTPKGTKSSGKILFNCLKNLSNTANNLCEKVKSKNSVFIDLTPTTVSPPKHYGTLKRSLSEEHIYAEPSLVTKSDSSKLKSPAVEPLHYMCSSLLPPALPKRDKPEENRPLSKATVRSMIYGSFASLRVASKENGESTTTNSLPDSTEADLSMKAIQDRIIYVKSVRKQASSSSICLAPKLYEALFIINIVDDQPQVAYSFPLKVDAEYNIPLLPHICFPDSRLYKSASVYQSEVFHFSLTDKNENTFGYCLRIQGWPEKGSGDSSVCVKLPVAICILSSFSAPVFYRKLLFEIEKHLTLPRNNCFKYIRSLRKLGVPNAGASLSVPDISEQDDDTKRTIISRPLDSHFVGIELTRTLQLLDVDILVKCVASLFLERRILFFSALTSNLYHCCKAISSLLYPFEWPHEIVPVLPACLTIHCCSEQPYVLGIVNNNCDSVLELLAEHELLIIDVDKGTIIKSCSDEDTILPKKVQRAVISALNLAKNMTDPTEMLRDIMISEAVVHMSVEMIGHYENHFTEINGETTFQKESFLKHAFSQNIRSFLQWFTETQMFHSFIEDSLWRIKYRNICQTSLRTFFEKRVDEYKWELAHDGEKISRFIGKTVRNFGEKLKGLKKC